MSNPLPVCCSFTCRGVPFVSLLALAMAASLAELTPTAEVKSADTLAAQLARLESNVFPADGDRAKELAQMLFQDVRARRDAG